MTTCPAELLTQLEAARALCRETGRDLEADAENAEAPEEKVFE